MTVSLVALGWNPMRYRFTWHRMSSDGPALHGRCGDTFLVDPLTTGAQARPVLVCLFALICAPHQNSNYASTWPPDGPRIDVRKTLSNPSRRVNGIGLELPRREQLVTNLLVTNDEGSAGDRQRCVSDEWIARLSMDLPGRLSYLCCGAGLRSCRRLSGQNRIFGGLLPDSRLFDRNAEVEHRSLNESMAI
jgi:hypothetical protein